MSHSATVNNDTDEKEAFRVSCFVSGIVTTMQNFPDWALCQLEISTEMNANKVNTNPIG